MNVSHRDLSFHVLKISKKGKKSCPNFFHYFFRYTILSETILRRIVLLFRATFCNSDSCSSRFEKSVSDMYMEILKENIVYSFYSVLE